MHNNGSGYVAVTGSFQISVVKHNACLFLLTCAKDPPGINGGGRSSLCCPEDDGPSTPGVIIIPGKGTGK